MCLQRCRKCNGRGVMKKIDWLEGTEGICPSCNGHKVEINIGHDEDSLEVAYLALKFILDDVELYSTRDAIVIADAARALGELMVDNLLRKLEQKMEP